MECFGFDDAIGGEFVKVGLAVIAPYYNSFSAEKDFILNSDFPKKMTNEIASKLDLQKILPDEFATLPSFTTLTLNAQ